MKTDLSNPVATAEFSKFAGILSVALSQHHLLVWNSSTRIWSPPWALFIVMLPKAHLTSHSRISGSRWVINPSWSSGSWRSFLYSSSVYYCHLFLILSASVRSIPSPSFIEPIFSRKVPLVSLIFLKSSLVSYSVVLYFFALTIEECFLISPCYSLELCIQMGISFLFSFAFHFYSQLFERPHQQPLCLFVFPFLGVGLDPCLLYNVTNLIP